MSRDFIPDIRSPFLPELIGVEALEPYRLRTQWSTGEILVVDVGDILQRIKCLAPILDMETFKKVHLCEGGGCIEWLDCEFGADNVYAWAIEQTGQPSHEMFWGWLFRNKLTKARAARILGVSERAISCFASARKKIPWHIWYACVGYELLAGNTEASGKAKSGGDLTKEFITTSLKMFRIR